MQGLLGCELHDGGHADPQVVHSWFFGHGRWAAVVPIDMQYYTSLITHDHMSQYWKIKIKMRELEDIL